MPVTETTVITGYPLPGHEIFLLDENRQPVKPGETGEIAVRTRYLASGYWKQPELTAKKFVQDPHDPRIHTFFTATLAAGSRMELFNFKDVKMIWSRSAATG